MHRSYDRRGRIAASVLAIAAAWPLRGAALLPAPDIPAVMRLTVDSWVVSSAASDLLPYGFDFMADKPIEADRLSASNLIRQASSAAALASYYAFAKDARLRDPIRRMLSALDKHSIPIGKGRLQRLVEGTHILSSPVGRWKLRAALGRFELLYQTSGSGKLVSPDGTYGTALAGTVALALLTEVIYAHGSGDEAFAGLRAAWLDGLLNLHIPGGGFRRTPVTIDDSDYDNGEGWLALAVYCDVHRDDVRTASVLSDVDDALMRHYSENPNVNFFGWGAMAAAQRYRTTRDPKFLAYLRRQGDNFVERFQLRFDPEANNCAAMEGVGATIAALNQSGEKETDRVRAMYSWLSNEVRKLERLQIQPSQQGLALGGEAYLHAPRMAQYAGGFLAGVYTPLTRIDAAGHCLSAMVMIERDRLL